MNRKITRLSIAAFLANRSFCLANTSVHIEQDANTDGTPMAYLKLHGNTIARRNLITNALKITTAGWNTPTTRARLNGLPGVRVCNRKGELYLNGEPWNGEWKSVLPTIEIHIVHKNLI